MIAGQIFFTPSIFPIFSDIIFVSSLPSLDHISVIIMWSPEELRGFDAIMVGVPTYHHDMTVDIKTLFEMVAAKNISLKGKVGAAFGSYGWSGEAPRLVLEIMKNKFEMDVVESPLTIKYAPDQAGVEKCKQLGKKVAERLRQS
jgi:flavorubredoxin